MARRVGVGSPNPLLTGEVAVLRSTVTRATNPTHVHPKRTPGITRIRGVKIVRGSKESAAGRADFWKPPMATPSAVSNR
jgi:hypothetical protein